MNTNTKLKNINDTIKNSTKSYFERNKEEILKEMKASREALLNGTAEEFMLDKEYEDIDYSAYIYEANIIPEELQYNAGDSFRIGNNLKGGI